MMAPTPMTYTPAQLKRMSLEEIAAVIEEELHLDTPPASDKATLVNLVLSHQAGQAPSPPKVSGERVRIIIHKSPDTDGKEPVKVCINGEPRLTFLIKRGEEVSVPREILGVLNDAVITQYVSDVDHLRRSAETREERVPRFAYTVLGDG